METTKTKKMSLGLTLLVVLGLSASWLMPDNYFQPLLENELIKSLRQKLEAYTTQLPEDRLYLQIDKPMYEPGDDIWISAFIRDGSSLKPSAKSDIVYIELLNPRNAVEKKISVIAKNGKAAGDFALDKELPGGIYKLKAYTSWMKNMGEENAFIKEIQVQELVLPNLKMKLDFEKKAFGAGDEVIAKLELNSNENKPLTNHPLRFVASLNGEKLSEQMAITDKEGQQYIRFTLPQKLNSNDGLLNVMIDYNGNTESISRSIPIVLNTVNFRMYPEGGDLVNGLESQVAFRALNEFGKPADVEGIVLTEKGSKITSFSSYSKGMGGFRFTPQSGERYRVKITKPAGITETYPLPEALERGYVMNLENLKPGETTVTLRTTETEELALIAQMRGKLLYSTVLNAVAGTSSFKIATDKFPAGVLQFTLFDAKGIARAERLAFVNRDRQLNISVTTEKEKYLPREKVRMTVSVKDERGLPMPANLSMAVVNDQLLSFADDRSGTIVSQLLLQQDLKEKIEEPGFYFDKKESRSLQALDYVLMTAGWRRFTWEKIQEGEVPAIRFPAQKAIVAGTILDLRTQKPLACVKIKNPSGGEYLSDDNGKFSISKLDLSEPVSLQLSMEGYNMQTQALNDYGQNLVYYMYRPDPREQMAMYAPLVDVEVHGLKSAGSPDMLSNAAPVFAQSARRMSMLAARGAGRIVDKQGAADAAQKEKKPAEPAAKKATINNKMMRHLVHLDREEERAAQPVAPQSLYYRARQFPAPAYAQAQTTEVRSDFRNTIYWNSDLEIGYSGKKTIEFYTSDDITSFRTTVEGLGSDGTVGHAENVFFTQLPFTLTTKIPTEAITEDLLSIPLTLKNNTNGPLGGVIHITVPEGLKVLQMPDSVQTLMPGQAKTVYLNYEVLDKTGKGDFTASFKACGLSDAFSQKIKIAPKGFPAELSFSSQAADKEYSFEINHLVKGSLKATFTAFPNVVSDLVKGVEGILQEPYGCFEQTSCTAYPNAMVLDYLKNSDSKDTKTLARATELLDRGYKRLTGFESSGKGYEWFGANPAHEGLTAYGIMEFVDMKRAGQEVDQVMLDRTARWLLNHRDGKGGFERERHAYHDFGRISDAILNAYIVYALADAGYTEITKEFNSSYEKALSSGDPYMLAMMTNAAYSLSQENKGNEALGRLLSKQEKDGSFNGTTHSITYSQGSSLRIETTALSILALLKAPSRDMKALNNAVHYLTSVRSGSGVFSSTQGTILALKALTAFAKFSKRTSEGGTIVIFLDNKKVAEKTYQPGEQGAITVEGLEKFIKGEGTHQLRIKYLGVKTPLPYSVAMNWNTSLPSSDAACAIGLTTQMAGKEAAVGETLRMTATLTNKNNQQVPSTMAIIGIPAGFTAQTWQLKELQEKNVFDYYEIKGNSLAIYYRGLDANAVKVIPLDLKAEVPGSYSAPASVAYLYYTNELKTWTSTDKVQIKRTSDL